MELPGPRDRADGGCGPRTGSGADARGATRRSGPRGRARAPAGSVTSAPGTPAARFERLTFRPAGRGTIQARPGQSNRPVMLSMRSSASSRSSTVSGW